MPAGGVGGTRARPTPEPPPQKKTQTKGHKEYNQNGGGCTGSRPAPKAAERDAKGNEESREKGQGRRGQEGWKGTRGESQRPLSCTMLRTLRAPCSRHELPKPQLEPQPIVHHASAKPREGREQSSGPCLAPCASSPATTPGQDRVLDAREHAPEKQKRGRGQYTK